MFQEIKDAVSVREAASFYRLKMNRSGMCCCPFHNDKHPSMKVDRRFHCFGCGADGDVIDLVQRLFGLDAKAAAFKLIDDLHLAIDTNRKETKTERETRIRQVRERERELNIRRAYAKELEKILFWVIAQLRILDKWEQEYAPRRLTEEDEPPDARFLCAVRNKGYLEYILSILSFGKDDEKYEVYKHREEIKEYHEQSITGAEQRTVGRSGEGVAYVRRDAGGCKAAS